MCIVLLLILCQDSLVPHVFHFEERTLLIHLRQQVCFDLGCALALMEFLLILILLILLFILRLLPFNIEHGQFLFL